MTNYDPAKLSQSEQRLRRRIGAEIYDDLQIFREEIRNGTSIVGKLLSSESIAEGARQIEYAEIVSIVRSGNGALFADCEPELRKFVFPTRA